MIKLVKALVAIVVGFFVLAGASHDAQAAVIVDPDDTTNGAAWYLLGETYVFSGGQFGEELSITVDSDSTLDIRLRSGSKGFGVALDGADLAPSNANYSGGYFYTDYDDVALSTGGHTLEITYGGRAWIAQANYQITVTGSDSPSAVPEPATLVLLGTGLAGLAGMRRRRQNQAAQAAQKERHAS